MLQSGQPQVPVTPAPEATPAATATPPVVPGSTPQPASTPAPGSVPAATPATSPLTIDWGNGQVERFETEAQLVEAYRKGALRMADYTRKTQEAARVREEAQTLMQQLQPYQQFLPLVQQLAQGNVQQVVQQLQAQVEAQKPLDPNAPVTVAQTMQLAEAMAQRIQEQQQLMQTSSEELKQYAQQMVQDQLQTANYAERINGTLNQVYTEHPILSEVKSGPVPELEQLIRFRVVQMQPGNIDEAIQATKVVAKEFAEKWNQIYTAKAQQQQVQRQQVVSQGLESPGGVAPQPAKQSFGNGRSLDWKNLREAAASMVRGQ